MEARACMMAALMAVAALVTGAEAQPAGTRGAGALRASGGAGNQRKVYDFIIQKAEVRELSSGHLFLPPPKPIYGPPQPPPPQPPPSPARHSTLAQLNAADRRPAPAPATNVAPARAPDHDSEKLQKKQPPSKQKPTSKERERDEQTRRLLLSVASPLTGASRLHPSDQQHKSIQTQNAQQGSLSAVQLPPYYPVSTYATYALPTYFAHLQQQPLVRKTTSQFTDPDSNSVDEPRQGEVPSLLGLDAATRTDERSKGDRRGKSMGVEDPQEKSTTKVESQYGTLSLKQAEGNGAQTKKENVVSGAKKDAESAEDATGSSRQSAGYVIGAPSRAVATGAKSAIAEAAETAKAEIAEAASRAAAGEVAGPGLALPAGRLVTQLALRRQGGVAIAGPGGTAAAGAGGVAVVGPGGVAYARPNALSVVGPGGRVVALPAGVPEPRAGEALPAGARVVALGPTIYLHPADAPAPPLPTLTFY